MDLSVVGGLSLVTVNVKPQIQDPRAAHLVDGSHSRQLRLYTGEAGLRTRARLLAKRLLTWFRDVAGGELHDGNVVMEDSLEGVRFQLLADYYLQLNKAATAADDEVKLRQYALVSKATCMTTDDFLQREMQILALPGYDFAGVECTTVSAMSMSGFHHSNGVRVVFGQHHVAHNRSPENIDSRNRMGDFAEELTRMREVLANNAQAIQRRDWGTVRRNKNEMTQFISMLRQDTHFKLADKIRRDFLQRVGESNSMEHAVEAGAFKLFSALVIACCAVVRACYVTRSSFLEVRKLTEKRLSIAKFRENVENLKFGDDLDVDEMLVEVASNFRDVVERAQGEARLEHAYLMTMDDSTSGLFRTPARKYRPGDLYKLSMEKLSKTNLIIRDDECVAFGKDVVSVKVLGKRVIRAHEEQMIAAGDAFGFCQYLGQEYSLAAVMLAVLNIIKISGCDDPTQRAMFDKFIFDKVWDDICTATSFQKSTFAQVVLDFFPKHVSLCNAVARQNRTCLYPTATYFAMVIRARATGVTLSKDKACWLWQTMEVATTDGEGSGEIVPDEALFVPYLKITTINGGTEALQIAGTWYRVERNRGSDLLHVAGTTNEPGESAEVKDAYDVYLGGRANLI